MTVQYNVSTLLREPVGATREYDIDDSVLVDEETPAHRRLTGYVAFLRTNDGVLVRALLRGGAEDVCSRCLRKVEVPLEIAFEEQYYTTIDPDTGARMPEPDDVEAFRISPQHTLDLEEAIRQAWAGALPLQPLCRPECKGLCPRCGKDLNESPCGCGPELDERWSALRQLATRSKEE